MIKQIPNICPPKRHDPVVKLRYGRTRPVVGMSERDPCTGPHASSGLAGNNHYRVAQKVRTQRFVYYKPGMLISATGPQKCAKSCQIL